MAALTYAGVGDQDPTCDNDYFGCPGPGGPGLPCTACFLSGDRS